MKNVQYLAEVLGEYYLSGSMTKAYKAPNNVSSKFIIVEIVKE